MNLKREYLIYGAISLTILALICYFYYTVNKLSNSLGELEKKSDKQMVDINLMKNFIGKTLAPKDPFPQPQKEEKYQKKPVISPVKPYERLPVEEDLDEEEDLEEDVNLMM